MSGSYLLYNELQYNGLMTDLGLVTNINPHTMFLLAEPLITNPTWIVLIVLSLILFTPMLMERVKVPAIVGLILAGMLVGPHGVHVLDRDASFEIFGKVGLYYIMFLASLGMNLTDVHRYRWGALAFGAVSFVLPMGLGFLANDWGLGLSVPANVLIAAMYSGHTLLTYPLVMRWGLARHRAVGIAVGGTILTNVLTLVVLAVVGGMFKPEGGDFNVWLLLGRVLLVTVVLLLLVPRVARWTFRRVDEGVVQYIFVLILVFLGAGLMEWVGMEGILGAFLVGLALNREVPAASPLMQRIEFVGNALFIPYFLIGVGMIINLRTLLSGWHIAAMALAMIAIGTAGKLLAAQLVGRALKLDATERNMVGGLSTARAASALAIAMVGYEIILPDGSHLLNEDVVGAAMMLILGSCIIASTLTERAARRLMLSGATLRANAEGEEKDSLLVALANPRMVIPMTNMALMLRSASATAQLTAVSVVLSDDAEERATAQQGLDYAAKMAATVGVRMQTHCRRSVNAVTGIVHTAGEHDATDILIGLHQKKTILANFFGKFATDLFEAAPQQIMVYRPLVPIHSLRWMHIVVPHRGEFDPGFRHWATRLATLSVQLSCRISVYGATETLAALRPIWQKCAQKPEVDYQEFSSWDDLLPLASRLRSDHLAVFISARRGMPSHHRYLDQLPMQLERYFSMRSWMIVLPKLDVSQ